MHELAAVRGIQLAVHFMPVTEQGRFWKPDPNTWRFEGRLWPGFRPVVGGVDRHFNPSLLKHLVRHPPDWLVVGGWIHPTLTLILAGRWLMLHTWPVARHPDPKPSYPLAQEIQPGHCP